jgi:hypothetical protein
VSRLADAINAAALRQTGFCGFKVSADPKDFFLARQSARMIILFPPDDGMPDVIVFKAPFFL